MTNPEELQLMLQQGKIDMLEYMNAIAKIPHTDYMSLGEIRIGSTMDVSDIIAASADKHSMTLTVRPRKAEDIECEIIDTKVSPFDIKKIQDQQLRIGALEDIECEIISHNDDAQRTKSR